MKQLTPNIWITGSARRVGRAIALESARAGWDVVVHYRSSGDEAREVAAEIEGLGRRALVVQGDQSLRADVERMVGEIRDGFGRLDALVNSAATFPRVRFEETTDEEYEGVLAANLRGPFLCSQLALPLLRAAKPGRIINLTDCMLPRPYKNYAAYWCAKGGLDALTRALAVELGPDVLVNAIAPGPIIPPEDQSEEFNDAAVARSPLKRWGDPADIARAVLFLLESNFLTGETITVDGGRSRG
jgi:NAD(P)-dependent dehydrogenase (short-subunit alcohol dehydrogenase family)